MQRTRRSMSTDRRPLAHRLLALGASLAIFAAAPAAAQAGSMKHHAMKHHHHAMKHHAMKKS